MAKIVYPESSLERDHLRDALHRRGKDSVDEIAAAIRERWNHSPLRSYRLALELSLTQVCDQVNRLLGVFAGETGYVDHTTLSRFEWWPVRSRRPTVSHLAALARVYQTSPRNLIAPSDWDRFPPADQFTLNALDALTTNGTTASAAAVGMMEMTRPQAGNTHDARTPWAPPDMIRSGNTIEGLVLMAGEESTRYADHGGNIGDTTLDQLRVSLTELAGQFANAPRTELFGSVRLLRDRIFAYLDGGQPMRRRRDLYFLAAAACGMLATVSDDLGYSTAAMAQARAGQIFAHEAADPALIGWLYARQSLFCYWNGQPGKARDYARRGTAIQPAGTTGVWLPAIEARACGELGDVEAAHRALRRAAEARERLRPSSVDAFGGLMEFNLAKQQFYGAGTHLGISDYPAVIEHADATVEAYENGPAEDRAYDNMAVVRLQGAIAQVRIGNLDAAAETARMALQLDPKHRIAHVDKTARRLHRQLCAAEVRTAPLAIDTRDQIENFLSTTPARPELA